MGFGGLYTALSLHDRLSSSLGETASTDCQITLIEQKQYFYCTPLLYELVTAELEAWQIAPSYAQLLQGKKIAWLQAKVENLDLETHQIQTTAAYQEAFCVADNIVGLIKWRDLKKFKYFHLRDMLTLGKSQALVSSFGLNIGGKLGDEIMGLSFSLTNSSSSFKCF